VIAAAAPVISLCDEKDHSRRFITQRFSEVP
jgi:hypothetical protein